MRSAHESRRVPLLVSLLALASLALSGCSGDDGDDGPAGPPGGGGPTDDTLEPQDDAPGVHLTILELDGHSGPGGAFRVGDHLRVTFRIEKDDGSDWDLAELDAGRMLVSGPTFNYQRVLPEVNDVIAAATENSDGSYTYAFAAAIPATYAAPLNDSPSFDATHGELAGQALLDGTYTLGAYFGWNYTVESESFRDVGNATADFLLGAATTLEPRAVVGQENCNQCHQELQAHGGLRRDVTLCLLCHTAGAEDRNVASAAGGTPGVSIDFRTMIHKVHNGAHLPSVLGVATNPDGSRNYAATPQPYQMVGFGDSVHDFSGVAFPVWPNGLVAMPRDEGYTALSAAEKALEDSLRSGASSCNACHGDPDGSGPIGAPAQGGVHTAQASREACGACHDDIAWGAPYTANGQTMPAQANDSNCMLCHTSSGNSLSVEDAHRHPVTDPGFNPGLAFDVASLVEAGTNDGDGRIDPGEKVEVTFTLENDAGDPVAPAALASISTVISGPTSNLNLLLNGSIPTAALVGPQPFTIRVPEAVVNELVGTATGGADVFVTARAPHWNVTGALTTLQRRTGTSGGAAGLSAAAGAVQNFLDVSNPSGFARDDFVVVDDGVIGNEEYLRVQLVQGNRLWVTPGTRKAHSAGASVLEVQLAAATAFTLDAASGTITENGDLGAGAILATYTSDFVMPAVYPLPLNESPDLGEAAGEWRGKPVVDGTYSFGMWGQQNLTLALYGETNAYRNTSLAGKVDFLVGSAAELEPYDLLSSGDNCNACHQDVQFHGGGRRGYDACLLCHGTAGSEDRAQYTAANAPATTGTTISGRGMFHAIHMGEELANASAYTLVGFGSAGYPNNFTAHTYEHVVFPALPGGVQSCAKCHGEGNGAWHEPEPRNHPGGQSVPTRAWSAVCGSCHDSDAARAHVDVQTAPNGAESCTLCHGVGEEWNVELMHKTR